MNIMQSKITFTDKQAKGTFSAYHASQGKNSGNHPDSPTIATEVAANKSTSTYPSHSIFGKFDCRSAKRSRSDVPQHQPKVKQTWWSRRRVAKTNPTNFSLDRTITSPIEELSRYGFVMTDLEDDNDKNNINENVTTMPLTKLQQQLQNRNAAKYEPWDATSFADSMKDISHNDVVTEDQDSNHNKDATQVLWPLQHLYADRIDEDLKYIPWDANLFRERTIISPTQDLSLHSFDTVDFGRNKHDGTLISLAKLQQMHNHCIAENAKYTPWDTTKACQSLKCRALVEESSLHSVDVENDTATRTILH